ncbi:MAG: hypothetical protein OEL76_10735 [Siculibacillus sp.]|nr:hypothetical protein [Siculibacillus sp.]
MTTTQRNPYKPGSTSAKIWAACDRLAFSLAFDPRGNCPCVEEVAAALPGVALASVRSLHSHWVSAGAGRALAVRRRRRALKEAGAIPVPPQIGGAAHG